MDYEPRSLREAILHNNYFFGLQVAPGEFVPLRVTARNLFQYEYDPLGPAYNKLGANNPSFNTPLQPFTFIEPFRLGTTLNNVQDVFQVTQRNTVYQLFFGFSPDYLWFYKTNPFQTRLGNVENLPNVWGSAQPVFGFSPPSPIDEPSAATEVIITQGNEFGPALYNPQPYPISPIFMVWINKLAVEVVTDPKLVAKMALGTLGTMKEISGTQDVIRKVNTQKIFGIAPISTAATESEIASALAAVTG
jgi:hypothetical protein